MIARVALFGIYGYQRWLSPRKDYRCAYSVRHGGTGCSGCAKHAIRDHGFFTAIPLIKQRFADCKLAAQAFAAERAETEEERKKRRKERRRKTCSCCVEAPLYAPASCRLSSAARGGSTKTCDTNPCDGDIGCGACSIDVCSSGG